MKKKLVHCELLQLKPQFNQDYIYFYSSFEYTNFPVLMSRTCTLKHPIDLEENIKIRSMI